MLPYAIPDAQTERDLFSLVARERLARDTGNWDLLDSLYWSDSLVRVTWFTGTSHEFVEMSRERARGGSGMHAITPVVARVDGDRALVESRGQIILRPRIHDVQVDLTSWCRFFSRAERDSDSTWRLRSFDSIYVKDRVDPVDSKATLELDPALLAQGRESYRHLRYLNVQTGYAVPDDLPGVDRPDLVDQFVAEATNWLHGL